LDGINLFIYQNLVKLKTNNNKIFLYALYFFEILAIHFSNNSVTKFSINLIYFLSLKIKQQHKQKKLQQK